MPRNKKTKMKRDKHTTNELLELVLEELQFMNQVLLGTPEIHGATPEEAEDIADARIAKEKARK